MKHFLGIPLPSFTGTSAEAAVAPLLADVARPIAEAAPSGRDVSYDGDFLRLKEEIDRLNAVDIRVDQEQATDLTRQLKNARGRQGPRHEEVATTNGSARPVGFDAALVVSLAHSILRDQSKDIRVAAYLALGLARRDGLRGVADGARAMELIVRLFWGTSYPPMSRIAGRMNAIESGVGWLRESVDAAKPVAADRAAMDVALRAVAGLRELATPWNNERVTQRLTGLESSLGEARAKLPSESMPTTPRSRSTPTGARSKSTKENGTNGANGVNGANGGADRSVAIPVAPEAPTPPPNHGLDPVLDRASRLLKEDPKRALPYRLVRVYRWDALVHEPPNTRKRTLIEPPPVRRRDYLTRLHAEQQWIDLVLQAEESFGQHPFHFWLDLQRFVLDALSALGPAYAPAHDAALTELQLLVRRLPGLSALTFADATRFASPAVVSWLDDLTTATATPGASETRVDRTVVAGDGDQFANARQRFIDGDLNGALALLERGAVQDTSDRQRFQRRVYMASLCVEAGQLAVARALLEDLSMNIELHGLARWEPELAMTVWTRQYACYASLAGRLPRGAEADQLGREMESVFGKICRVDTSRALATAQEARRPP